MKKITAVILVMMMLILPAAAFAAGTVGISFSGDNSAFVGEVFAVVVTFSAEENIAALQAEFTYDEGAIRFLSGGNSAQAEGGVGSISGSGGAQSLSYSLEFRAMTPGETAIEITNVEVISDETGMMLGSPSGSVDIVITEKSADEPTETPETQEGETEELPEEQTKEETTKAPEAEVIIIDGKKYIPADAQIKGYMLLGDEDGKLWLYRTSDGMLAEYTELKSSMLWQPAEIPEEFTAEDTVTIDGIECRAIAAQGGSYVYLTDASGTAAWYVYDENVGLLRKTTVEEKIVETVVENENTALMDIITLVLAGMIVIAVIVLILVLRRKRR